MGSTLRFRLPFNVPAHQILCHRRDNPPRSTYKMDSKNRGERE